MRGSAYLSRYNDSLRAGRSGDRILVGGGDFPHPSRPALRPTQPTAQLLPGFFPGGKAAETWRWTPTLISAEVKERIGLHVYCSSGASRPVIGWTLHYRGADKSLDWPDWKKNWKVAIFRPTRRSLLSRWPGWTEKLLNFFWVACRSQSLVAVASFPPGRAKDLSTSGTLCNTSSALKNRKFCPLRYFMWPTDITAQWPFPHAVFTDIF